MTNQPLTSGDQSKIITFFLLLLPSVIFGVGVIPAIFLIFGIFMMKKNEDFSHIETAVKVFRVYTILALLICIGAAILSGLAHLNKKCCDWDSWFFVWLFFSLIPIMYLIIVAKLFYNPLSQHKEWVEINGIFATKPKSATKLREDSEVDIIKGEKLKQYSVADELIKWAKLKEEGHISESEFNEARAKLLKRN